MTEWSISLPYRDRSDPVSAIADAAGAIPDRQEREVVRGLALEIEELATLKSVKSTDPVKVASFEC